MNLLVIVPTRGRPENAARLEANRKETCLSGRTDFLFVVDSDDPKCMDYCRLGLERLAVIPRQRLGPTLNFMAARETDDYEAVGFMGDDHLPRTRGWDIDVLDVLGAGIGETPRIAYGNDLLQGPNLPTAVFMDRRIIRGAGHMVPPGMVHLYLDNYWKALGERLGSLIYLPNTVIEHIHPAAGKAPMDAGYQEANAPAVNDADRAFWLRYEAEGNLEIDARRVERLVRTEAEA